MQYLVTLRTGDKQSLKLGEVVLKHGPNLLSEEDFEEAAKVVVGKHKACYLEGLVEAKVVSIETIEEEEPAPEPEPEPKTKRKARKKKIEE